MSSDWPSKNGSLKEVARVGIGRGDRGKKIGRRNVACDAEQVLRRALRRQWSEPRRKFQILSKIPREEPAVGNRQEADNDDDGVRAKATRML